MADEDKVLAAIAMDRAVPVGNSADVFSRRSLHVKVGNSGLEPIPVSVSSSTPGTPTNIFGEVSLVASGVTTEIVNYTVPALKTFTLQEVQVSGDNIALFALTTDAQGDLSKVRTYFGSSLNETIGFGNGLSVVAGDVIRINVTHTRPDLGTFEARIFGILS